MPRTQLYPLAEANRALQDLKYSRFDGPASCKSLESGGANPEPADSESGPRGAQHFGLIRALSQATRRDLQRGMEPGVGVNKWLFAASICCLSKGLWP